MTITEVASADSAEVRSYLMNLQTRITRAVSELDRKAFLVDAWQKPPTEPLQGDGVTMILEGGDLFERAAAHWRTLVSDEGAAFDRVVDLDAASIQPQVTWGTSPEMVLPIDGRVPDPDAEPDPVKAGGIRRALDYMGLTAGMPIVDIRPDKDFIGSCTN